MRCASSARATNLAVSASMTGIVGERCYFGSPSATRTGELRTVARGFSHVGGFWFLRERLLQELLGRVGPDVALGLRIEQRFLDRSRLRARDVVDAAADPAEQRFPVVRVGCERSRERLLGGRLPAGRE